MSVQNCRVTVSCRGLLPESNASLVSDVLEEFAERPWNEQVRCEWRNGLLVLAAQSYTDTEGKALLDEFWDVVIACAQWDDTLHFDIESVVDL